MKDINTLIDARALPLPRADSGRHASLGRSCRLGLLAFLITVACYPTVSAQSPKVAGKWKVVASPNGGTQAAGNALLATIALSPTDAWAVGAEPNPSQYLTATLAEHWNGKKWSIVQTPAISAPTVQLNSISAVGSSDIWAAGYAEDPSCFCSQTVVERWDGTSWTRITSPNPGIADFLYGITALSSTDVWAAGYEWTSQSTYFPFLMHYDGHSWSTFDESQFQMGQLSSVFALATNDVWAVGWFGPLAATQGLALHWDGESWTQVAFPSEQGGGIVLQSVSGAATNDFWAVGVYQYINLWGSVSNSARGFHWNDSTWKQKQPALSGESYFSDVMARATNDVWLVGEGIVNIQTGQEMFVTLHWNGSQWSNVTNPDKGTLNAVSASSGSDAWAVGVSITKPGTYTMHYVAP